MRQAELTVTLPPSTEATNGDILARTYPVTIACVGPTDMVRLDTVSIAPASGIAEVWVSDPVGGRGRRQMVERATSVPQAQATGFRPLTVTLVNLNPDAAVDLVIELSVFGPFDGMGGPARFAGTDAFGTTGAREANYNDQAGNLNAVAYGAGFLATMVTNGPTITRTIRDITGRTRILAPSGTGALPTPTPGGSTTVTIIIKRDGSVLESSASTLDITAGAFLVTLPSAGEVHLDGLADDSVKAQHLEPGAVDNAALANGVVSNSKLADGVVGTSKLTDGGVTGAKLANGAVGASKLGNGSVGTAALVAGAIQPAHLNDTVREWVQDIVGAMLQGGFSSAISNGDVISISPQYDDVAGVVRFEIAYDIGG